MQSKQTWTAKKNGTLIVVRIHKDVHFEIKEALLRVFDYSKIYRKFPAMNILKTMVNTHCLDILLIKFVN